MFIILELKVSNHKLVKTFKYKNSDINKLDKNLLSKKFSTKVKFI